MRFLPATLFLSGALALSGCGNLKTDDVAKSSSEPETVATPSAGEPLVRVRIVHTLAEAGVVPSGSEVTIHDADGKAHAPAAEKLLLKADGGDVVLTNAAYGVEIARSTTWKLDTGTAGSLLIEDVPFGVGWWWENKEDRLYEGVLHATAKSDGTLDLILELPVEEYLRGVVPSEIGGTSPMEALKAQAVAARSETMTALAERTYAGPGFDICSDVNCQVYSGTKKRTADTDAAIEATRGVILSHGGKPIPAFYASNCGGHSEDIGNVWSVRDRGIPCWSARFDGEGAAPTNLTTESGAREWATTRPNVYCNPDFNAGLPEWTKKNFRWTVEKTTDEMTALVGKKKDIGKVTAIEPLERGPSGRLIKARFVGENGSLEVGPELAIRQIWEPPLKSSAFIVDRDGDTFRITGAGYGHGVGMCQTGAIARAQAGQDYVKILQHYYKDAEVGPVYK